MDPVAYVSELNKLSLDPKIESLKFKGSIP